MTFNTDNPNSLFNCIARARENARGVRETISAEMWENLNTLYWTLRDAPARFDESPEDVYRQVMIGSMLFQGLTDQTLQHDQRWQFIQLGKFLERIDVTSRMIGSKFSLLKSIDSKLEAAPSQYPLDEPVARWLLNRGLSAATMSAILIRFASPRF